MVQSKSEFKFIAGKTDDGKRIDIFVAENTEEFSRSFLQKNIEEGNIFVNGELCDSKKYKITEGDEVSCFIAEPKMLDIEPQNIPLDILFEDDDLIIVDKPAGMVVHPAAGNYTDTLVNALMYHCKDKLSSINGIIRPGIVHRIDKDTSGILMVAKNDKAHNALAKQLKEHTLNRRYCAIVYNNFADDVGTVDMPIGRNPKDRKKQSVFESDERDGVRNAVTHYKILERFGDFTLIECKLETGRTHQIRVHMSYIKHPILGDSVYGPDKNKLGAKRQMLHAYMLGITHPTTGEYIEFKSKLPKDFEDVLLKLRKRQNQD